MSTPARRGAAFLRQEGLRAGLTKHHLDGPGYHAVFGGVRVPATTRITTRVLAEAAVLVCGDSAVVSHHSAAVLWGGVVPDTPWTHVSVPSSPLRIRRDGVRAHRSTRTTAPARLGSLPLTSPVDTFLDLAKELDLVDLVVLGDSLVRAGRVSTDELCQAAAASQSPGARSARCAAALVRDRVDSPMETRLRLLLVFAGLPEPVVNLDVVDSQGVVVYRLDLAFPGVKVAVEYDGRQHAEDDRQWGHDLTRREDLDGMGWRLVVCRAPDVYTSPEATVARVAGVLRDRGMRLGPAGATPMLRRHFPGRGAGRPK